MITPKNIDMNRSRDVKGPELKRPQGDDPMMKEGLFHDSHPTGTLNKEPLQDLHDGQHKGPLSALGEQKVVVSHPMGSDSPDHQPKIAKGGGLHDQSKGMRESMPKGMGRSVAKEMEYAEKKKDKY